MKLRAKASAPVGVREALHGRLQARKRVVGAVDAVEPGCEGARECGLELGHQVVNVDGSLAAGFWIGRSQRLGDLVAQTDVVHDQAVSLLLAGLGVGDAAVGAGDGLEEGVPPQRLV